MGLPTNDNILTMDFHYMGEPFVHVPAKDTIDTTTMDYHYKAEPFVVKTEAAIEPININTNFFLFF